MSNILILGHTSDIHIVAVTWALKKLGHTPTLWLMDQFPVHQAATIAVHPDGTTTVGVKEAISEDGPNFDVVWIRRQAKPTIHPDLHPSDREAAARESRSFITNALNTLAPSARWVNPLAARNLCSSKALQLGEAVKAGFDIPDTLISNDPDKIRAFCQKYAFDVILKPFYPASWKTESAIHIFFATRIDPATIESEFSVRAAPAIFQRYTRKDFELRITVMGATCFAARISARPTSQPQTVDWKEDLTKRDLSPFDMPDDLRDKCLRLMRRLGIVFGCIDVIRQPDGHWTFLEVNEMGAFLWVEEYVPGLPLLAAFSEFLLDGSPEFHWSGDAGALTMAEYTTTENYKNALADIDPVALKHQYPVLVDEVI